MDSQTILGVRFGYVVGCTAAENLGVDKIGGQVHPLKCHRPVSGVGPLFKGEIKMGTWGAGNFDNDTAAEHMANIADYLITEIETAMGDPVQLEPDEYWGNAIPCNLELLVVIGKLNAVGFTLPEAKKVASWKETFLEVWDRCIDDLEPKPQYKINRRKVLVRTFNQLIALSKKHNEE